MNGCCIVMKLLLIEDAVELAKSLVERFGGQGYVTEHVSDGIAGLFAGLHGDFGAIIVDRMLSVTDDGPGIEPTDHEKVLRRFYRVSSSRSTSGHGLGLALVAAIAQLHHATLALSSADPGLRVTTTFPSDWDD